MNIKPSARFARIFLFSILICACCAFAREKVGIDVDARRQPIEGWGLSLCWWAAEVGKWDDVLMDEIVDFLVSPDKLNMNLFRYNIGGGDDPAHFDTHMLGKNGGKGKRAQMEGFKDGPAAPYDWSRDAGQRKVMLKIRQKRPDAVFEAFSNSPPYWMTISGCSGGHFDKNTDNLDPKNYAAFCDYLVEVCKHYKEKYGLEFDTLEPFNEPLSDNWFFKGSQEGCHFEVDSQIRLIRILHKKLEAAGLNTRIAASDETNVWHGLEALKGYAAAGDILEKLKQFGVHTYGGDRNVKGELAELARASNVRIWQSESGPVGFSAKSSHLYIHLKMAQRLFEDLTHMRATAWLDWQALDTSELWSFFKGGFYPPQYGGPVKNAYVRMQVTRFFKQGYILVESGNENALAAISPDEKILVVALINHNNHEPEFRLEGLPIISKISAWRTSANENCAGFPAPPDADPFVYKAPPLSITTFVMQLK